MSSWYFGIPAVSEQAAGTLQQLVHILYSSKVHCIEATWGAEIIPQITVEEPDYRVIKRRFSGFFATDLEIVLRGLGTEELVICGIAGDGCVRATAVDAHQLGFHFKIIEDAVAGLTRESCRAALSYLATLQKDVLVTLNRLDEAAWHPAGAERG